MRISVLVMLAALVVAVPSAPSLLSPAPAAASATENTKTVPEPGKKVTFLELGSVGCIPCEQMVPVMDAVRQKHGARVDVVFRDVRRDPAIGRQWRVVLIPTQVFLDADGKEVFRHQGYFALADVLQVLKKMGVD